MRQYISDKGLRDVFYTDDELLDLYTQRVISTRKIETVKNRALFRRVVEHPRVLLRDPLISIEALAACDFIVNTTEIFIQAMPKQVDYDTHLILSNIEGLTSIGLSLYVHTVNKAYIEQLHRNAAIDQFLKENP